MGTMVHDCPHCKTAKVAFSIESEFDLPGHHHKLGVAGVCNACGYPVCAIIQRTKHGINQAMLPSHIGTDVLSATDYFSLHSFYPTPITEEAPEGIPDLVAKAFRQAAGCRAGGHFDAAAGMYRRAMELGLKAFSAEVDAWKLEKRIDKMAAQHLITPELQTWAHELRLDGNDAMHGEDEVTRETADQMHELCKFLLIYLYTLPTQVKVAKERRASQ